MNDKLPIAVLFQKDGHLDDIALSALADGQDAILTAEAIAHANACDACTHRMGEFALASAAASNAFAEARAEAREPAADRFPWPAVVCALVLAAIGALPHLQHLDQTVSLVLRLTLQTVPTLARAFPAIVKSFGPLLMLGAAFVLLFAGGVVVRLAPREAFEKGAVS